MGTSSPITLNHTVKPGTQLGPYKIVEPLGKGGMGEVYRAHDPELGRQVAIKLLPEDLPGASEEQDRLLKKARTASSLNHPHICTVHEVGESEAAASWSWSTSMASRCRS